MARDEQFEREMRAALCKIPGLDPTPILCIHSMGWTEDGKTFQVYVDLPGGIARIFSFTAGEPVHINDHGGM